MNEASSSYLMFTCQAFSIFQLARKEKIFALCRARERETTYLQQRMSEAVELHW